MTPIYVVEIGPNLYMANLRGLLISGSTRNITDAKWFLDAASAEQAAKKLHGRVQAYMLERAEERDSEIDMLRSAVIELQRERDELLEQENSDAATETGSD